MISPPSRALAAVRSVAGPYDGMLDILECVELLPALQIRIIHPLWAPFPKPPELCSQQQALACCCTLQRTQSFRWNLTHLPRGENHSTGPRQALDADAAGSVSSLALLTLFSRFQLDIYF